MKTILASASPRRRELIKLINSDALCISADIDENVPESIEIESAPEFLACKKAIAVAGKYKNDLVIGCDTTVFIESIPLGKPKDRQDAFNMLNLLSGRSHKVITGCCLCLSGKTLSFSVESKVRFLNLNEEDINEYLNTNEYIDKAGAYGIQGKGSLLVEKIEGDYFNIVGLPVSMLNKRIKEFLNENNCKNI